MNSPFSSCKGAPVASTQTSLPSFLLNRKSASTETPRRPLAYRSRAWASSSANTKSNDEWPIISSTVHPKISAMRGFANKVSPSGATIHMPSRPVSTIHWYSVSLSKNRALSICIVFTIVMDSPPRPCQAVPVGDRCNPFPFCEPYIFPAGGHTMLSEFSGGSVPACSSQLERFANQLIHVAQAMIALHPIEIHSKGVWESQQCRCDKRRSAIRRDPKPPAC